MTKPKFIYFDVGGVLLHFIHIRQELAEAWGISLTDLNRVLSSFELGLSAGTVTEMEVETELRRQFKLTLPAGFYADGEWVKNFRPIPEMHALITDLIPHYRLGLLTNVTKQIFEKGRKIPGFYPTELFEIVIKSYEVGLSKPDPKIYELAIAKTGLQPAEIFFVDDLEKNIQAAAKLGIQVFRFNPDHVIKKTAELRQLLLP